MTSIPTRNLVSVVGSPPPEKHATNLVLTRRGENFADALEAASSLPLKNHRHVPAVYCPAMSIFPDNTLGHAYEALLHYARTAGKPCAFNPHQVNLAIAMYRQAAGISTFSPHL